jgi:hypothetical protein
MHVPRVGEQRASWDVEPISLRDDPDHEAEPEDAIPAALEGCGPVRHHRALLEDDDDDVASPATGSDAYNGWGTILDEAGYMVRAIHPCCWPLGCLLLT